MDSFAPSKKGLSRTISSADHMIRASSAVPSSNAAVVFARPKTFVIRTDLEDDAESHPAVDYKDWLADQIRFSRDLSIPVFKKKGFFDSFAPLKALTRVTAKKSLCHFTMHVHGADSLPESLSGRQLTVVWQRRGMSVSTSPCVVRDGVAQIEQTLDISCTLYYTPGPNGTVKYQPKSSSLSVRIAGPNFVATEVGKHIIDLAKVVPNKIYPSGSRKPSAATADRAAVDTTGTSDLTPQTMSFNLDGKAAGSTLAVTFGYEMHLSKRDSSDNKVVSKVESKTFRSYSLPSSPAATPSKPHTKRTKSGASRQLSNQLLLENSTESTGSNNTTLSEPLFRAAVAEKLRPAFHSVDTVPEGDEEGVSDNTENAKGAAALRPAMEEEEVESAPAFEEVREREERERPAGYLTGVRGPEAAGVEDVGVANVEASSVNEFAVESFPVPEGEGGVSEGEERGEEEMEAVTPDQNNAATRAAVIGEEGDDVELVKEVVEFSQPPAPAGASGPLAAALFCEDLSLPTVHTSVGEVESPVDRFEKKEILSDVSTSAAEGGNDDFANGALLLASEIQGLSESPENYGDSKMMTIRDYLDLEAELKKELDDEKSEKSTSVVEALSISGAHNFVQSHEASIDDVEYSIVAELKKASYGSRDATSHIADYKGDGIFASPSNLSLPLSDEFDSVAEEFLELLENADLNNPEAILHQAAIGSLTEVAVESPSTAGAPGASNASLSQKAGEGKGDEFLAGKSKRASRLLEEEEREALKLAAQGSAKAQFDKGKMGNAKTGSAGLRDSKGGATKARGAESKNGEMKGKAGNSSASATVVSSQPTSARRPNEVKERRGKEDGKDGGFKTSASAELRSENPAGTSVRTTKAFEAKPTLKKTTIVSDEISDWAEPASLSALALVPCSLPSIPSPLPPPPSSLAELSIVSPAYELLAPRVTDLSTPLPYASAVGSFAAPGAPPELAEGMGSAISVKYGGLLVSMSKGNFEGSNAHLVMQMSRPVVVPTGNGGSAADIIQSMALLGSDALAEQVKALMPLDEISGKSVLQIASEGGMDLSALGIDQYASGKGVNGTLAIGDGERLLLRMSADGSSESNGQLALSNSSSLSQMRQISALARLNNRGRHSNALAAHQQSQVDSPLELPEDFVSLEELAPLAIEQLEAMSLEGLRVQNDSANQEAPAILPVEALIERHRRGAALLSGNGKPGISATKLFLEGGESGGSVDRELALSLFGRGRGGGEMGRSEEGEIYSEVVAEGSVMSMAISVDEWLKLDVGVVPEHGFGSEATLTSLEDEANAILASHRAAHGVVPLARSEAASIAESNRVRAMVRMYESFGVKHEEAALLSRAAGRKGPGSVSPPVGGLLSDSVTIAVLVQLRDPNRNFEPVGSPMIALMQAERATASEAEEQIVHNRARGAHLLEGGRNAAGDAKLLLGNTTNEVLTGELSEGRAGQGQQGERQQFTERSGSSSGTVGPSSSKPLFKLTGVHMMGLKAEEGSKGDWGTIKQATAGNRWMAAHGMGKKPSTHKKPSVSASLNSKGGDGRGGGRGAAAPSSFGGRSSSAGKVPGPGVRGATEQVTVRRGDTLWSISSQTLGEGMKWKEIAKLNPHIRNPDLILPHQKVRLR